MAARRVTWTVVLLLLGVLCGCAAPIEGTARAGAPPAPASSSASPSAAAPPGPDLRPGQCVGGADLTPIDCARPHTVEIIAAGRFDASLPGARPADATVYQAALPACRVETGSYLGNGQYDASTIGAYLLWPGPQEWVAGQRWYFCGVAQLAADGTPVTRDGTARGALAGDSLYAAQLCSSAKAPVRRRGAHGLRRPARRRGDRHGADGRPDRTGAGGRRVLGRGRCGLRSGPGGVPGRAAASGRAGRVAVAECAGVAARVHRHHLFRAAGGRGLPPAPRAGLGAAAALSDPTKVGCPAAWRQISICDEVADCFGDL
jgi:hypothetical protein